MEVGLVGFPGAGKSTMFSVLTGLQAAVGYQAGSDKPNLGVIKVPDPRLDALAEIYKPKKLTPAEIRFVDFPGQAGAKSHALDARVIAQMRDVEAFALIVRGYADAAGDPPDPVRELRAFFDELVLADLAVVEKRLDRTRKEKGHEREQAMLDRCLAALEDGKALRQAGLRPEEEHALSHFAFVSLKPLLVVLNVSEDAIGAPVPPEFQQAIDAAQVTAMAVCGQIEMEVEELAADERAGYLRDLGIEEPARARFIQASYALLDLISFLTVGTDEVRAWPIAAGTPAVKAAGKIHSDLERGFIRAEVTRYEDLLEHRSEAKCREVGKLRVEGKEYVVQDGDVMHVRFAV
jgi:GTP-binding protein YchF